MDESKISEIVSIVEKWFDESPTDKEVFLNTSEDDLIWYHHTLGTHIRNEFKLWELKWTPEMKNGSDHSPGHPDQVSMEIIKRVHKNLKREDYV